MKAQIEIISDILSSVIKILLIYQIFIIFGYYRTIAIIYLYYKGLNFFLQKYFKIERIDPSDRVFLGKDKFDRYNVVIVLKMKDFSETKMKEFLIERVIKKFPKFSKRLIERLHNYYWKEIPIEIAINNIKNIKPEILNKETELNKYINTQVNLPTDIFNSFGYEFHLIKFNDNQNEGALVFKFDHAFSDGLGALSVIACIADNYDKTLFPRIMQRNTNPFSISNILNLAFIWKLFYDLFKFPFILYKCTRFKQPDHVLNPSEIKRSGESIISLSKAYDFENLFNHCKKLKLSFNEFLISIFSAGLKRYLNNYEISCYSKDKSVKLPKNLIVIIPIGNRGIPKSPSQFHLQNLANVAFVNLPLIDDPIKNYNQVSYSLKSSIGNIYQHVFNKVFIYVTLEILPKFIYEYCKEYLIKHVDMCISNVPGSKRTLMYSGSEVYDIIPVVNCGMNFSFTLMLTYNNNLRFHLAVDKVLGINPNDIIECLESTIDHVINLE